jgi:hypothetical protein
MQLVGGVSFPTDCNNPPSWWTRTYDRYSHWRCHTLSASASCVCVQENGEKVPNETRDKTVHSLHVTCTTENTSHDIQLHLRRSYHHSHANNKLRVLALQGRYDCNRCRCTENSQPIIIGGLTLTGSDPTASWTNTSKLYERMNQGTSSKINETGALLINLLAPIIVKKKDNYHWKNHYHQKQQIENPQITNSKLHDN